MITSQHTRPLYIIPEVWLTYNVIDEYTVDALKELYQNQIAYLSLF